VALLTDQIGKLRKAIQAFRARPRDVWGLATGLAPLDQVLGGLQETDLCIIGGRPSMGKTAAGMQFGLSIAEEFKKEAEGQIVYIGSAEMRTARLLMRWVGAITKINPAYIKRGLVSEAQMEEISKALAYLETLPIYINDTYGMPVEDMRADIERLEAEQGIHVGWALYDYIQLADGRGRNDFERASWAGKQLKKLANEHEIPVVGLSQLNRNLEDRSVKDKTPTLADLKNSSDIEDVTDVVLLLYRPNYYRMQQEGRDAEVSEAQIIVAKNRDGQTGTVNVRFDPVLTTFLPAETP
jgi:replicative DNA helicase